MAFIWAGSRLQLQLRGELAMEQGKAQTDNAKVWWGWGLLVPSLALEEESGNGVKAGHPNPQVSILVLGDGRKPG